MAEDFAEATLRLTHFLLFSPDRYRDKCGKKKSNSYQFHAIKKTPLRMVSLLNLCVKSTQNLNHHAVHRIAVQQLVVAAKSTHSAIINSTRLQVS